MALSNILTNSEKVDSEKYAACQLFCYQMMDNRIAKWKFNYKVQEFFYAQKLKQKCLIQGLS